MHPLLRVSEELPVPPGESPFHIRGLYYDRLRARLSVIPGGLPRVLDEIRDPRVRAFIDQRFAWLGWYDVFPVMPIFSAIARVAGVDFETAVREGTRHAARALIPSVFRLALQGTTLSPTSVAQIVLQTVDFVRPSFSTASEGRQLGSGAGVPLYVAPHMANLVLGFFAGMLEVRGMTDVRAECTRVEKETLRSDFETVTLHYEFGWRARPR